MMAFTLVRLQSVIVVTVRNFFGSGFLGRGFFDDLGDIGIFLRQTIQKSCFLGLLQINNQPVFGHVSGRSDHESFFDLRHGF